MVQCLLVTEDIF